MPKAKSAKVENTQYGLKNKLKAKALSKISSNQFMLECISSDKTNKQPDVYLHILFLSEDIIRFHYSSSKEFELNINPYLEFENFNFKDKDFITKYHADNSSNEYQIETDKLVLEIIKEPLVTRIYDHENNILSEDISELGFITSDNEVRCYKRYSSLKEPPIIYGLGDKSGPVNRWGSSFSNAPIDALGYDAASTDPLYKDIPFFIHLEPSTKLAHGIFLDNFSKKRFNFGKERKPDPYYYFSAETNELNYYFINGPRISDISSRFQELCGKAPLMPKLSFGYLASGMAYTEVNDAQEAIYSFLENAKKHEINVSAFHLSSGYTLNKGKRHQLIWNKEKFPKVKDFIHRCREILGNDDFEFCANLKPVLHLDHPYYNEAKELDLFITENGEPVIVDFWGGQGSYMDFHKAEEWWLQKIQKNLLDEGVLGIWNDNNEYEIFTENHNHKGQEIEQPLLMNKIALKAHQNSIYKDRRPWILTRSSYAGFQKYAQTWTGDNYSSWQSLKYDNAIVSSLGVSGVAHAGVDIGGFWGDSPSSELLMRWIQNGIFTPRFCIHSYKEKPTEAWTYADSDPESFRIIQKTMQLREKLQPYIYQANYKASTSGEAIQRITSYDFQEDPNTYNQSFEYMFGAAMLIAPVYEAEQSYKKIYLPRIEEESNLNSWINFWDYREYYSGQNIDYQLNRENIPVFVRADSIVPLVAKDALELKIFVSSLTKNKTINYSFYEDDGKSLNYQNGDFLITKFQIEVNEEQTDVYQFKVKIIDEAGSYQSDYENIHVNIIFEGTSTLKKSSRTELKTKDAVIIFRIRDKA